MGIGKGVEQHGGDVAVHYRNAVLRTPPEPRLEPIEELLTETVGWVVLVDAGPAEDGVPHHWVEPRVLERGAQIPRRVPLELLKSRVYEDDAEPKPAVDERLRLRFVQRSHGVADVVRRLGDGLLGDDADPFGATGVAERLE